MKISWDGSPKLSASLLTAAVVLSKVLGSDWMDG
jgi:hypothetical protein